MAGQRHGRCRQCDFDPSEYDDRDAINTVRAVGAMFAYSFEGTPDWMLTTRVDRRTWSMAQYLHHVRQVTSRAAGRIEFGINGSGATGNGRLVRPPTVAGGDVPGLASAIGSDLERIHLTLVRAEAEQLDRELVIDRRRRTVRALMEDVLHECIHHLADVARVRHELGGMIKLRGRLSGIHTSPGGVPKQRIETARVDRSGIVGDTQAARLHHGRPWQALCLYSADAIERLAAEGHPIAPGRIGENLTISSVDWSKLRPGLSVKIGGMTCLLSAPAVPCAKIGAAFSDGDYGRVDHDKFPGEARWYASVLVPGVVVTGDRAVVSSYRPW